MRATLLLLLAGCVHRVPIESTPAGAQVLLPDGTSVTTPTVITVDRRRGGDVTVTAPGYRTLVVDLHRAPRRGVELILVPEHGPAGTWRAEEIE